MIKPKMTVKPFSSLTTQELFKIYQLRVAVFVVEQQCPYQEVDGDDLRSFHLMLQDDDGSLMAYARIIPEKNQTVARIGRVIVAPDFRKAGLGRYLIQVAINQAIKLIPYTNKIVLAGQAYLKDFYHSFGFHDVSDVYLEDDIPHIDMEMVISNRHG
ncbi:MAG: GNAT family N-acetyltransferase [Lentilactobacillus diolivorans]|nr:GNAT family N-acetyltransferase [Lentilactobacillus diolivorans]